MATLWAAARSSTAPFPSSDATRFTNDGTGHGMFVSIENLSSF